MIEPRAIWVAVAALTSAITARADDTVARDAYRRAEELANASPPRWAEACPLYEASYRADPQIGVLLHLADCHEHVGRFASAWAEFNDAAELARSRGDSREAVANTRADALVPKLSKLQLKPPATSLPGLKVARDGVDITVLVGKEMPVDPGDREVTASAPGYLTWTDHVEISGPGLTSVQIPDLVKAPEPPPSKHEGSLTITSQADAEIWIDSKRVGTGRYTGILRSGGHTLRVVAPRMRAYQTEIAVADGSDRTIDVPLEAEVIVAPPENLPSFELGANLAPGVKLRTDNPAVVALRLEAALRLGRQVNLGVYGEYGRIATNGSCGTLLPGPDPATDYDFGPRGQMLKCQYLMPGLQLYVHVLPKQSIDPWFGLSPGFRFGSVEYKQTFGTMPAEAHSLRLLGIVLGVRAGVMYHLHPGPHAWSVGGYLEGSYQIIGDPDDAVEIEGRYSYWSVFVGGRSTVTF